MAQYTLEQVQSFRLKAERGDARAQNELGYCYSNGIVVSVDKKEAAIWYRKAAEQGLHAAQANLAFLLRDGNGVEKNEAEAVFWLRKSAEQGNKIAQNELAVMLRCGKGTAKNETEAVEWHRKSAEQGFSDAQNALGYCYDYGIGVQQDKAEAEKWYRKAAEQGHSSAQSNLAFLLRDGDGIEKNEAEAVFWFRKSAEQGNKIAQNGLAVMLRYGKGTAKNETEAVEWYRKAAEQGHRDAQNALGYCYDAGIGVQQDKAEAAKWYRKAAEQGHRDAQSNLAFLLRDGKGIEKNEAEAVSWFRKSAEQGSSTSQYWLANCLRDGTGTEKNEAEAEKWYRKAADQGRADAQNALAVLLYLSKNRSLEEKKQAVELLEKASQSGLAIAMSNLGYIYEQGVIVKKSVSKAYEYFVKASEKGYEKAKQQVEIYQRTYTEEQLRGEQEAEPAQSYTVPSDREQALQSAVQPLEMYSLDAISLSKLERFVRYQLQKNEKKPKLPFYYAVHSADTQHGLAFVSALKSMIERCIGHEPDTAVVDERNFCLSKTDDSEMLKKLQNKELIILTNLISDVQRSMFERSPDILNRIDIRTEILANVMKQAANAVKILCDEDQKIEERLRKQDHPYNRMFREHIYLSNFGVEQIEQLTHETIQRKGYKEDESFTASINEYIRAVYPSSEIKNNLFVQDLTDRTFLQFYDAFREGCMLDKDCVPSYRKPKTYEETASELEALVGLKELKKQIRDFEVTVQYAKKAESQDIIVSAPTLHMLFLGNPGTGKTTVAKLLASILQGLGIIQTDKLVVAERKDLVGEYIGHTAQKTYKVIQSALDGVLLIDEAYSLAVGDSSNDFGKEAIATLLTAMVDYADRLVVIFAGYAKEMREFINMNSGIASRIGYTFTFEDYSSAELQEIFERKTAKHGYVVSEKALSAVYELMETFRNEENFGNGRFVERVFERTVKKHANRLIGSMDDAEAIHTIEIEDIPTVEEMKATSIAMKGRIAAIGF